jgi:hypothetical protein
MANTIVNIATSDQTYTMPGTHWTQAQIVSSFSTSVAGIGSMEVTITGGEDDTDKIMTFRPRTGTKG